MKKLLLILMIMPCLSLASEEHIKLCTIISDHVETMAGYRNRNMSLSKILSFSGDNEMFIKMAMDVYKRTYLTPKQLGNQWMLNCLNELEGV